jgi:hypothetical protein
MLFAKRFAMMLIPLTAACGGTVVIVGTGGAGGTGGTHVTTDGCTSDLDCAAGELCDVPTGTCVWDMRCTSDADCGIGDVCDTVTGICEAFMPPGCVADTDCAPGYACDLTTGLCEPSDGPSCHQCACVDTLSEGGCANICDDTQNGTTTPNFCNGVSALPQCAKCLADNCAAAGANPTDPTGCM